MGGILELIKLIYGSKALSKVLGTRTNVIRLPDNELKQYTKQELNIEAASNKLAQKVKADMYELLADYPRMNDAEKLIFEGNLRRLGNKLEVVQKKQKPAADVLEFETGEKVSPEGIMSLTEKAGQKNPPTTLMGNLESRIKQLEASGEDLSKMKGQTYDEFMNDITQGQRTMIKLEDEGLVRATAREIIDKDIKSKKIKLPKEIEADFKQGGGEPIDVFRQFYGEDALEQLNSMVPDFRQMYSPREAAEAAIKKFKFKFKADRAPESISIEDARKAEQEFGINKPKQTEVTDITAKVYRNADPDELIDEYNKNLNLLSQVDEDGGTLIGYEQFKKLQNRNTEIEKILNSINIKSADSPEGKKITEALIGKPKASVTELVTAEKIISDMKNMDPMDAMKEANKVLKREGKYKNLKEEDVERIMEDTNDFIFGRDIPEDPEGFAVGGRVGMVGGGITKLAKKLIKKTKKYKFTGEESLNDLYELERQGKITREDMNVYSPRYLEYLDAQIIKKEKLYTPKEWEKTSEVLKNKMRGRIDPDWEEANFGEDFNWDQARSTEMKQQQQLKDFDITGRTKNSKGGVSQGLDYLMGIERRGYQEGSTLTDLFKRYEDIQTPSGPALDNPDFIPETALGNIERGISDFLKSDRGLKYGKDIPLDINDIYSFIEAQRRSFSPDLSQNYQGGNLYNYLQDFYQYKYGDPSMNEYGYFDNPDEDKNEKIFKSYFNQPYQYGLNQTTPTAGLYQTTNPNILGYAGDPTIRPLRPMSPTAVDSSAPASTSVAETLFPQGDFLNIRETAASPTEYNIEATKDLVENLPSILQPLAPAAAAALSLPYDAIQAYQRMEPDSGIAGFRKAFQAERPLKSAFERFVGASGPLAENINTAVSSLNPYQQQRYMNYALENPDRAIQAAQRDQDFRTAIERRDQKQKGGLSYLLGM
jgi:uncharacterized protein YfcZ (UPF0381/DUF406 family)